MRNPVALLALVLLASCAQDGPRLTSFDPPNIESWTGEPQVAAKIRAAREKALKAPDSSLAAGRLGMVFHAHELHAEAVASYRRAMELAPAEPRWPYLAALATAETDLEGAIGDFERAAALGFDHPAPYVNFGDALARLGRAEEASRQYEKALELDPSSTHARYGLGRLALGRGEPKLAAEHLEEAAGIAPRHGEVHTLLAQVYRRLGRAADAERELLLAGAHPDSTRTPDPILAEVEAEAVNSRAYSERGQRLAREGRFAEAEPELRKVLAIRPGNARDFSNLGGALAGQGKLGEAVEQYGKALAIDPDNTYARNNLGMALAGQGDLDGAAAELQRAVAVDPAYADAHRNLGLVRARQGRHEEAIAHYRQALEHNPSLAQAHNDLGTALAGQGQLDEAIEHWRQALAIDRRALSALYNLSVALVQRGEHREAVGRLRRGIEIAPNSSRLVSLLAWELATAPDAGLRDGEEAVRLARRVYESYPDQPQAGDVLAAALASQGRFEEATAIAERTLARAQEVGQRALAAQIKRRLELYRRQQPFDQGQAPGAVARRPG